MGTTKLMNELVCPECGYTVFLPLTKKGTYECANCHENIEFKGGEKISLSLSDSFTIKTLAKAGIDVAEYAAKSETIKKGVIVLSAIAGVSSVSLIAVVGLFVAVVPGMLKDIAENKLFSDKSVQKQFESLYEKRLREALNKGKNRDKGLKYFHFRLYFDRCREKSDVLYVALSNAQKNIDFLDKDSIVYIYKELGYTQNPTDEELANIIKVAGEIQSKYKEDILKDPKLRESFEELERLKEEKEILDYLKKNAVWIEDKIVETNQKIDKVKSAIDNLPIKADNTAYIDAYLEPLFFEEDNRRLTLGRIYVDPSVEDSVKKASEVINEWYKNDDEHQTLLVLGSAGIGKSSLCSKIMADAVGKDIVNDADKLFDIPLDKVHIKALRGCVSILEGFKYGSIRELIEKIFAPSDMQIKYDNDLFILDGLDELAVLCPEFDMEKLFSKLKIHQPKHYKLLITSRETTHYGCVRKESHLAIEKLKWNEDDMNSWCDKYCNLKGLNAFYWCDRFRDFYGTLHDEDERKKVFCVPVILYIAAHANVDFSMNSSIVKIYNEAFRSLLYREHTSLFGDDDAFVEDGENLKRKVYWQYTKELAHQMAISGSLILSDTDDSSYSCIDAAQKMTCRLLGMDQSKSGEEIDFNIDNTEYLSVFQFARSDESGLSIEFVHKTVYEYFAAVKLYEDYFKDMTTECSYEDIWQRIVQAFRYTYIELDIMRYLAEMIINSKTVDKEKFYECVFDGIKRFEIYHQFALDKGISEYRAHTDEYMFKRICFSNLIKLLTLMDYRNEPYKVLNGYDYNCDNKSKNGFDACFRELLDMSYETYYDFSNWCFEGIDIRGMKLYSCCLANANMSKAELSGALIDNEAIMPENDEKGMGSNNVNMESAILKGATIKYSRFDEAKMKMADMKGASLIGVSFVGADLRNVDLTASEIERVSFKESDLRDAKLKGAVIYCSSFENADLRGADLRGIDFAGLNGNHYFRGAKYNTDKTINGSKTLFPKWFDPKKNEMILDNTQYTD